MKAGILSQLDRVFSPGSVAIVGVSVDGYNAGRGYLSSLVEIGFPRIFPVNQKGGSILGLKVYPSVRAIPGSVDLAILAVPREAAPGIVEECSKKGVKGIVIHSSGFREKGGVGKDLEDRVAAIARQNGIRIIGPNCMGFYNPSARVTMNGWPAIVESGKLGIISQSGYMAFTLLKRGLKEGLRFSKVISYGNECDLTSTDLLEYLGQDPGTEVIFAYIEGVKDGRRFFRVAREVSARKPVIVWKGGMTADGVKASASHTGSLAIPANVWRALCRQTGMVSVNSLEEALDLARAFYHLPAASGKRVGIISSPGGFAVAASDAFTEFGLSLAALSNETQERLARLIPLAGTSTSNPVDLGFPGSNLPEVYFKESIEIVGRDPSVDALLIIFGEDNCADEDRRRKVEDALYGSMMAAGKPLVVSGPPSQSNPQGFLIRLAEKGVVIFPEPRRAIKALARVIDYNNFMKTG